MEHEINRKLERLDPPLGPDEDVVIAISGVHRDVTPAPDKRTIHGFGMVISLSSGRKVRPFNYLSKRDGTTHQRGELGALLTAYQWIEVNAAHARSKVVLSTEDYLYKHLPEQIDKWVEQSPDKRRNLDILQKIQGVRKRGVALAITRPKTDEDVELHEVAYKFAQAAKDGITVEDFEHLPSTEYDLFDEMPPENEALMKTAIARDQR